MHPEGDPGGGVVVGEPQSIGLSAFEDHCQAFLFAEAAQWHAALQAGSVVQGAEHVLARVELRRQVADQGGESGFAGHGASFDKPLGCGESGARQCIRKTNLADLSLGKLICSTTSCCPPWRPWW